jgi:hypothetical protein
LIEMKNGVAAVRVGEDHFLVDAYTDNYVICNPPAYDMAVAFIAGASECEVLERISSSYDVSPATLQNDLCELERQLIGLGMAEAK